MVKDTSSTSLVIANEESIKPQKDHQKCDQDQSTSDASYSSHLTISGYIKEIEVTFDNQDPYNPHCWSNKKKVVNLGAAIFSAFSVTFSSALISQSSEGIQEEFAIGEVVATLATTSLFLLGYAMGPMVWGPVSELYGRKPVMFVSALGHTLFTFASATAKDIQTLQITRFFAGLTGGAPLVVVPAIMTDICSASTRGTAIGIYSIVLFGGPTLSPIISGFTVKNESLGWRWPLYFSGILAALSFVLIFFLEETNPSIVLVLKAAKLRLKTKNWGFFAQHEREVQNLSTGALVEKYITRPVKMLTSEIVLILITIYNSFIYGVLYLTLSAEPFAYGMKYGWTQGVREIPFIAVSLGSILGGIICILFENDYVRLMERNNGKPIPEARLKPMMFGGILFSGGLFWFFWSANYPAHVHWLVPTFALGVTGCGVVTVFLPCLNYIIDCYALYAASALAANTFCRSAFGSVFPLFAGIMLRNIHLNWTGTVLGGFAALLVPVPFLFYRFGDGLRRRSKMSYHPDPKPTEQRSGSLLSTIAAIFGYDANK
ncbi:Piso0_003679 [Millerozyma farinosa CBS 7064]|uniref:Piso0_003679 protein n=1 Tax=Pichia sorbitophila (strain ATCC MYA-4447 / BCRC 22081 / CBS 7064 / NBRC 10061 / NRRL Y-12695) TaxID=559304 RepID=G8Y6A8_PICSO|nr:Piso0_003679 [Millerozyma farinosa CBS 7064]CCE84138.1 Piso0_003679 [Millerozyma farinosa CBS 7064]